MCCVRKKEPSMGKETELKGSDQVVFEAGFKARIMGIDGTWWRECYIEVISQSGAKITVEGNVENLKLNEFFLMLSTVGNAHRKCELVYVKGDEIGVRFLQKSEGKRRSRLSITESEDFAP
jgi:PilZ domain